VGGDVPVRKKKRPSAGKPTERPGPEIPKKKNTRRPGFGMAGTEAGREWSMNDGKEAKNRKGKSQNLPKKRET